MARLALEGLVQNGAAWARDFPADDAGSPSKSEVPGASSRKIEVTDVGWKSKYQESLLVVKPPTEKRIAAHGS